MLPEYWENHVIITFFVGGLISKIKNVKDFIYPVYNFKFAWKAIPIHQIDIA